MKPKELLPTRQPETGDTALETDGEIASLPEQRSAMKTVKPKRTLPSVAFPNRKRGEYMPDHEARMFVGELCFILEHASDDMIQISISDYYGKVFTVSQCIGMDLCHDDPESLTALYLNIGDRERIKKFATGLRWLANELIERYGEAKQGE